MSHHGLKRYNKVSPQFQRSYWMVQGIMVGGVLLQMKNRTAADKPSPRIAFVRMKKKLFALAPCGFEAKFSLTIIH